MPTIMLLYPSMVLLLAHHQAHSSLYIYEDYNYSLAKPDPCFSFESLALQVYNKKVPDDEPATVPCLDTEA